MTFVSGRSLLRLAAAGAVAVGATLTVAGPANAAGSHWDRLAQCESGGNWGINSGNGYYGGLQFNPTTWKAYGGPGMPHTASREQQIAVAERVLAAQGWGAWPSCSSKMGLRGYSANTSTVRASGPAPKAAPAPAPKPKATPQQSAPAPAPAPAGTTNYIVKAGDTLSGIAAANGGNWQDLQTLNGLSNPHLLSIGQQLRLA